MLTWMNIKMALAALRSSKLRSFLTMLGVIIGVASVITVISIGEGVKKQVESEISSLGTNLAQVQPGKTVTRDQETGEITSFDFAASIGTSNLSEKDVASINAHENVEGATFISIVTGTASISGATIEGGLIVGTNDQYASVLNQKVETGSFFNDEIANKNSVVVGHTLADETLGGVDGALGRSIIIRGEQFTVIGVMEKFESVLSDFGPNINKAMLIPYETAKELNQGISLIQRINYKVTDVEIFDETNEELRVALTANHGGQENFSIIKSEELVAVTNSIFSILTSFVAAIASISLVVGGIGIMNIMLVSVVERTKEIGVRKSIGATNNQILSQFLIEALVLSAIGGLIGVGLALGVGWLVSVYSDLSPSVSIGMIVLATSISAVVGVVFGITPAWKAARKDPIESLRHE